MNSYATQTQRYADPPVTPPLPTPAPQKRADAPIQAKVSPNRLAGLKKKVQQLGLQLSPSFGGWLGEVSYSFTVLILLGRAASKISWLGWLAGLANPYLVFCICGFLFVGGMLLGRQRWLEVGSAIGVGMGLILVCL
jgi:hypothetical protein